MRAPTVAAAIALAACSSVDPISEEAEEVVNGPADTANVYPFVGALSCGETDVTCSGTLIGPHTFLTAAHCTLTLGQKDCSASDFVQFGVNLTSSQHHVLHPFRSPLYKILSTHLEHDTAVIKLQAPVTEAAPVGFAPPVELAQGKNIVGVGYGVTSLQNGMSGGPRRIAHNRIKSVATGVYFVSEPYTTPPQYVCHGDSGGPAFLDDGSPPVVYGVVSGSDDGGSDCTVPNVWAETFADRYFIARHLLDVGWPAGGGQPGMASSPIAAKYDALGGSDTKASPDGVPLGEELAACNGGKVAHLTSADLVNAAGQSDAHVLWGAILSLWNQLGGGCSALGYPTSDERVAVTDGRVVDFENGTIAWTSTTQAREVHGPVWQVWKANGGENGVLGYPTNNQSRTSCGVGFGNTFQRGRITWRSDLHAHALTGTILTAWNAHGAECGCLGLPSGDAHSILSGLETQQAFAGGAVTVVNQTGGATVVCNNPCANAADGVFCGDSHADGFGGTGLANTLYSCHSHAITGLTLCAGECFIQPAGHSDTCDACSFAADGVYCGDNTLDGFPGSGVADDLYTCKAHVTTNILDCPEGCTIHTSGADECTCAGPICGAMCCPAGGYCSTNGLRCCAGECTADCLC